MTTYIYDNKTFTPAQLVDGVRLVKGKLFAAFYTDTKATRTVIPTIIKAPNGELRGFYFDGGLEKIKKVVADLLQRGAKIENEVIVIDAAQFAWMNDGSNAQFLMWSDWDAKTWETSGVKDFRWNSTTAQYEYTPKKVA
jgi:hypothetical protein